MSPDVVRETCFREIFDIECKIYESVFKIMKLCMDVFKFYPFFGYVCNALSST